MIPSNKTSTYDFNCHGSLFTFTLRPDGVAEDEGTFKKPVSIPPHLDQYSKLVGHCNGLVVMAIGERCHLLMNPTTLEFLRLPELPSFDLSFYKRCIGYGFRYDSSKDDYKVVIFSKVDDNSLLDPRLCYIFADIYNVKTKYWSRVDLDSTFIGGGGNIDEAGVFVNGALHWMSVNPNDGILAFDLGSEKLYEIPSLGSLRGEHNYQDILIVSKGCLGIVCWEYWDPFETRFHIWTMNKHGMADSWTKNVYIVDRRRPGLPISINRPWRDALVIEYPYKLTFYSFNDEKSFTMTLDTKTIKDPFEGWNRRIADVLIFSESLVSLHHFDNTQQHEEEEEEEEQCPSHVGKKLKA